MERLAILRAGNRRPLAEIVHRLDAILRREAIGEAALAIAAPHDALNARLRGKIDLHPALALGIGNPTVRVARLAVVDVLQFVNRVSRQRPGSTGLRAL